MSSEKSSSSVVVVDPSELRRFVVDHQDQDDCHGDCNNNGNKNDNTIKLMDKVGRTIVVSEPQSVEDMGRVLFRERPIMIMNTDGDGLDAWRSYLDAYIDLSTRDRALILDMHTPCGGSDLVQKLDHDAHNLCSIDPKYEELGHDLVLTLMSISQTNAHEYYGRTSEDMNAGETTTPSSGGENNHTTTSSSSSSSSLPSSAPAASDSSSGQAALFVYGSKVAHGCRPNISYTSKTKDGCLEYKVIAPIEAGDVLTFAYIDTSPANPTHIRRRQLLHSKDFFCECDLCTGSDYSRAFRCPKPKCCAGHIMPTRLTESDGTTWSCCVCGDVDDLTVQELMRREQEVGRLLNVMASKLRMPGGIANVSPEQATELVEISTKKLSSTHFVTLKCQSVLARICATHAHGINQAVQSGSITATSSTPVGSLNKVRIKAASAGLEYIRRCECVAAKCLHDKSCNCNHAAVYESSITAYHAYQELKDVPTKLWPVGSNAQLRKYVPLEYVYFGNNDCDIQEMDSFLQSQTVVTPCTGITT